MRLRLLCFGRLRELLAPELAIEISAPATVGQLWRQLAEAHPALRPFEGSLAIAVNQSLADSRTELHEGNEVALLPPVSGGLPESVDCDLPNPPPLVSARARLQWEPIDSAALIASLRSEQDGARVVFEGMVRGLQGDHLHGPEPAPAASRRVLYLEYQAYPEMALRQMEELAAAALDRFAIGDLRLAHRLGRVPAGECVVVVAVLAAHRAPAFEACRFLIDRLKQSVAIWKKEFFEDGAEWAQGSPLSPTR